MQINPAKIFPYRFMACSLKFDLTAKNIYCPDVGG
jgi:hypothetical protein